MFTANSLLIKISKNP